MGYELGAFAGEGVDETVLERAIARHVSEIEPRLGKWWRYYRNAGGAQGEGLPARLRGARGLGADDRASRAPAVIENDIGWRVEALVDFVFGASVRIESLADDEETKPRVERFLQRMLEASGGMSLLRDAGTLAMVHGHADYMLRADALLREGVDENEGDEALDRAAELLMVDVVSATRGIALVEPRDVRRLRAYAIRTVIDGEGRAEGVSERRATLLERMGFTQGGVNGATRSAGSGVVVLELISASWRQVYENGQLVVDEPNELGALPVAHTVNQRLPLEWEGVGEVEPLVPLQDELNTRLSDRAHRVTMQSFNMYLAKGIESFGEGAVGPGQVWVTDNPDAEVIAFGGDGDSPSESAHIEEIRAAIDKASGVSPTVLGIVRERLGHLSSANALRITLMGVLAKATRRRAEHGRAIERICAWALEAADRAGVLRTSVSQRRVRVVWPDVLPVGDEERVRTARAKEALGVSREDLLREIGTGDPGVE